MATFRYNVTISHPATGEVIEILELELAEKPDRLVICACNGCQMHGEAPSISNQVDYCLLPK